MSSERCFYSSGELAQLAGVSTDTLRHYERKGVLARPLRKANDYRQYPETALDRVLMVRRALTVGFTLDELSAVLAMRDSGGAPCEEVRKLAESKLSNVETRLRELIVLRDELRTVLKDWDSRLKNRSQGQRVHLLENLHAGASCHPGHRSRVTKKNVRNRQRKTK